MTSKPCFGEKKNWVFNYFYYRPVSMANRLEICIFVAFLIMQNSSVCLEGFTWIHNVFGDHDHPTPVGIHTVPFITVLINVQWSMSWINVTSFFTIFNIFILQTTCSLLNNIFKPCPYLLEKCSGKRSTSWKIKHSYFIQHF